MQENLTFEGKNLRLVAQSSYNPLGALENLRALIDDRISALKEAGIGQDDKTGDDRI